MDFSDEALQKYKHDRFPRSARYDPAWVHTNEMGPNVLWMTEALSQVMAIKPGMRVLDLGCGTAMSSIFLAKEFSVQVWATDLWIKATDNLKRIREAKAEGSSPVGIPVSQDLQAPLHDGIGPVPDILLGGPNRYIRLKADTHILPTIRQVGSEGGHAELPAAGQKQFDGIPRASGGPLPHQKGPARLAE